jgi:hypothetical protein
MDSVNSSSVGAYNIVYRRPLSRIVQPGDILNLMALRIAPDALRRLGGGVRLPLCFFSATEASRDNALIKSGMAPLRRDSNLRDCVARMHSCTGRTCAIPRTHAGRKRGNQLKHN